VLLETFAEINQILLKIYLIHILLTFIKKNIGEGTAASSFSAVGRIWLGCWLEPASKHRRAESCHRCGPKTVLAQTAEITKCHVIFIVFFKF
jgi:hypothetical protein